MALTDNERRKNSDANKRKEGLIPRHVWIHETRLIEFNKMAAKMAKPKKV